MNPDDETRDDKNRDAGRTQADDSLTRKLDLIMARLDKLGSYGRPPPVWFHDILQPDGTPFRRAEVDSIRRTTGVT